MHIRIRLMFILALLLGLMACQVFITLSLLSHLAVAFTDISQKYIVQIEQLNQVNMKSTMAIANPNYDFSDLDATVKSYTTAYEGSPEKIASLKKDYADFRNDLLKNDAQGSYFRLIDSTSRLRDLNIQQIRDATSFSNQVALKTFYLLSIVVILVTVIGIIFGWSMARYFSSALITMRKAADRAAGGDFSPVHWDYSDEFGSLAKAFNNMLRTLARSRMETASLHEHEIQTRDERIRELEERLNSTESLSVDPENN